MFSSWTEGAIARVAELLRQGKSASEIGADLGVARNAVIGKVRRTPMLSAIGFSRSATGMVPTGAAGEVSYRHASIVKRVTKVQADIKPAPAGAPTKAKKATEKPVEKPILLDFVTPSRSDAMAYDEASRRLPLSELQARDCRWPVNDVPKGTPYLFCGIPAEDGHNYCLHHCLRGLNDGTATKAKLLDKAARQELQQA